MKRVKVSLDDKYTLSEGRVYITGTQALVRLPIMQHQRDLAAGLNTACFISGYRGSPLGGLDQQLWQARKFLDSSQIKFQPGVNEDLAATAIWGSQQSQLFGDSRVDGILGIWYGKGPGVDRSGDVFKHANAAGTSRHGGVLALAGDDHTCKSSTLAHQTEYAFMDAMIPVLAPAGVQEFIDLGLHGIGLSRYSGLWVAFKTVAETVDSSASVHIDAQRIRTEIPEDFDMPAGGLNIRIPHPPLEQEELLHKYKIYAALAYARANKLNRTIIDGPKRRLGIVSAGKSYLDVCQALDDLGINENDARKLGLSLYKVGMVWPLERESMRAFAEGLDEILVVEEKRALIENQLKEQLYNWRADVRPRVVGKFNEQGEWLLPSTNELTPAGIARVLVQRLVRLPGEVGVDYKSQFTNRLEFLANKERALKKETAPITRMPYFCSGCPHNSSTRVPEGSRALAGIGCHYMAQWMDRDTYTFTQMGGEGVTWVGQADFSKTRHVFANLGDGTYFHSGLLALRQAVASGVNITYKILYNDAVAMTGGQPHDGNLDVPSIAHQVMAEGARKLAIVSDEPEKYGSGGLFPAGTGIYHRSRMDRIQREFRQIEGVSVIIYDQTCAAEKRRRRKRGLYPDPAKRAFIHEEICEGCGDCGLASNCMSIAPKETEFGRKRQIDQSSCNKDFSCLDGFCPSFVTIHGGKPRKGAGAEAGAAAQAGIADIFASLKEPALPDLDQPYGILLTGVGGSGVVTTAALLGMAAHMENKGVTILDMAGLAQKGGAVTSHIRIARRPDDIHASRIAAGGADLLLGCDLVVAAGFDALAKVERGHTHAVINTHETITGDFTKQPDFQFPASEMQEIITRATGAGGVSFVQATALATALMGDSIATNLFMLGYAYQKGRIPVSEEAIFSAINLNNVAVEANKRAFVWGRRTAFNADAVMRLIGKKKDGRASTKDDVVDLQEIVARRAAELTGYQNLRLARKYENLVSRVVKKEKSVAPKSDILALAVARYYFKLLAYKDEYEVARLFTKTSFHQRLKDHFEGDFTIHFHLAAPLISQPDPVTGHLVKREFGPWMMPLFRLLKHFKFLRGTMFDIFGKSDERQQERRLIEEYEALIEKILDNLTGDTVKRAAELASIPEYIRGYGHVKERHIFDAKANEAELLAAFLQAGNSKCAAE